MRIVSRQLASLPSFRIIDASCSECKTMTSQKDPVSVFETVSVFVIELLPVKEGTVGRTAILYPESARTECDFGVFPADRRVTEYPVINSRSLSYDERSFSDYRRRFSVQRQDIRLRDRPAAAGIGGAVIAIHFY